MTNSKAVARSALLAVLGACMVSAQLPALPELAEVCSETAVEAPEICAAAVVACIIDWGIDALIDDSPYNQRAQWIEGFINNAQQNSPNLNTMAIATYYNDPFAHSSGVGQVTGDCGHSHCEVDMQGDWVMTQGFEIYTVGSNTNCCVEKWGDGGWTNWGWYGIWNETQTTSGSHMMCLYA
jgi:hypothetical protein